MMNSKKGSKATAGGVYRQIVLTTLEEFVARLVEFDELLTATSTTSATVPPRQSIFSTFRLYYFYSIPEQS